MDLKKAKELLIEERKKLADLEDQREDTGDLDESQQESAGQLSSHDQHPGDVGTQTFQRERDLAIEESLESKRNEIADALQRIENDAYGRCEVCDEEISDTRLSALPATRYCAEHASEIEEQTLTTGGGWAIEQDLGSSED